MPLQFNDNTFIRFHPSLFHSPIGWHPHSTCSVGTHLFRTRNNDILVMDSFIRFINNWSEGFVFNNRWGKAVLFLCLPLYSCSSLRLSLFSLLSFSLSLFPTLCLSLSLSHSLSLYLFVRISFPLTGCHIQPKRRCRKTMAKIYILHTKYNVNASVYILSVYFYHSYSNITIF